MKKSLKLTDDNDEYLSFETHSSFEVIFLGYVHNYCCKDTRESARDRLSSRNVHMQCTSRAWFEGSLRFDTCQRCASAVCLCAP